MKRISVILLSIIFVITFSTCYNEEPGSGGGDDPDIIVELDETTGPVGILRLKIDLDEGKNSNAGMSSEFGLKTAVPEVDMTHDRYRITGTCSTGDKFTVETEYSFIEIRNIPVGRWILMIESLNSDGISIGYGESSVDVFENETAEIEISVAPYPGFGVIQVSVEWDADTANPLLEGKLTRGDIIIYELEFEISGNTATAEFTAAAGYYLLILSLYDETGNENPFLGGAVSVVRVVADYITPAYFFIQANGEYGYGNIDINIDVDMNDPIGIVLTGQVESYQSGRTMTVLAFSPDESEAIEYSWFLNGEYVAGGNRYTTSRTLHAGYYRLDVTAFNGSGDRAGSVTHIFTITIPPPTYLSYSENPAVYIAGKPIVPNIPTVNGEEIIYSVEPDLPPGLSIDRYTGIISGTPVNSYPEAIYRVYTENFGGKTSVDLLITIEKEVPVLNLVEAVDDHITISWNYDYPYITGYEVYKSDISGVFDYANPLAEITSSLQTGNYVDYDIDPDITYYYTVRGFDGSEFSPASNQVSAKVISGLKGYWDMKGSVADYFGISDGTVYGYPPPSYTEGPDGQQNTAIQLSAWNWNYINFGNSTFGMEDTDEFTIAFWLRIDSSFPVNRIIVSKGRYIYPFALYHYNYQNNLQWSIRVNNSIYSAVSNTRLVTGQWYHITLNYSSGNASLYINGMQDSYISVAGNLTLSSAQPFVIGGGSWGSYSNTSVSGLRMYNRALSASDNEYLYNE